MLSRYHHILAIGSHCEAAGNLDVVPRIAQGFYAVVTDPERRMR